MSSDTQIFIDSINTNKVKKLISIGSSLKICLVAEGEADIYPRLGRTMEWDTAAAHAIINEAGASIEEYANKGQYKLRYNKKILLNKWLYVES